MRNYTAFRQHRQGGMPGMALLCGFALFSSCAPKSAHAETTVERFTHSLIMVYVASEMCKDTLSASLEQYTLSIRNYLTQYYPQGVGYWILPNVQKREKNRNSCISALTGSLLNYRNASADFQGTFPDEPTPPVLVAGIWDNNGTAAPVLNARQQQPARSRIIAPYSVQ